MAAVTGIQDTGMIATAKHWVNNEQETDRKTSSSDVDERTRFELYYPPFQAAVNAGVLSVMCSYNRINGVGACENNATLMQDLRGELAYDGWVMVTTSKHIILMSQHVILFTPSLSHI